MHEEKSETKASVVGAVVWLKEMRARYLWEIKRIEDKIANIDTLLKELPGSATNSAETK